MSEKLEQVAKAIETKAWELDLPLRIEECVDLARAAIEAMREPTEAMLYNPAVAQAGSLKEEYQAIIDESLK